MEASPITVTLPTVTDRVPDESGLDTAFRSHMALVDASNLMGRVHAIHALPISDMEGAKGGHGSDFDVVLLCAMRLYRDVVLACPLHVEFPDPVSVEVSPESPRSPLDVSLVDGLCVKVARFHYDLREVRVGNRAFIDAYAIIVSICTLLCGIFDDDEIRTAYDRVVEDDRMWDEQGADQPSV